MKLEQIVKDIETELDESLIDLLSRINRDMTQVLRVLVREGLAEEREFQTVFDLEE